MAGRAYSRLCHAFLVYHPNKYSLVSISGRRRTLAVLRSRLVNFWNFTKFGLPNLQLLANYSRNKLLFCIYVWAHIRCQLYSPEPIGPTGTSVDATKLVLENFRSQRVLNKKPYTITYWGTWTRVRLQTILDGENSTVRSYLFFRRSLTLAQELSQSVCVTFFNPRTKTHIQW